MNILISSEEVRAIHVVQGVVRLIRGRVLLLGSQVVSVRPTLPERPDPVVHTVVSPLKRQPRLLRSLGIDFLPLLRSQSLSQPRLQFRLEMRLPRLQILFLVLRLRSKKRIFRYNTNQQRG